MQPRRLVGAGREPGGVLAGKEPRAQRGRHRRGVEQHDPRPDARGLARPGAHQRVGRRLGRAVGAEERPPGAVVGDLDEPPAGAASSSGAASRSAARCPRGSPRRSRRNPARRGAAGASGAACAAQCTTRSSRPQRSWMREASRCKPALVGDRQRHQRRRRPAGRLDRVGQLLEPADGARHADHLRARRAERPRHRVAEAAARPGDERDGALARSP